MTHKNLPPHYSAVGIQMMGQMFEQQMRIAQLFGAAALASNAAFFSAPRTKSGDPVSAREIAKSSTQAAKAVKRTHSLPV